MKIKTKLSAKTDKMKLTLGTNEVTWLLVTLEDYQRNNAMSDEYAKQLKGFLRVLRSYKAEGYRMMQTTKENEKENIKFL